MFKGAYGFAVPMVCAVLLVLPACTMPQGAVLDHEVVNQDLIDAPTFRRLVYSVDLLAEAVPSEERLRATARTVWREAGATWTWSHVRMYLPGMDEDGQAYAVAIIAPLQGKMQSLTVYPEALPARFRSTATQGP